MTETTSTGNRSLFSAATLHEAAGRVGALPARLRPAYAGATFSGPARPVVCPQGDNLWLHRGVYAAQPGEVLVVATTGEEEYGYWGEILSVAAASRGLGGLVLDGGVRDTEVLGQVGFPVFAATTCMRGTIKDPEAGGGFPERVTIGGITIAKGDMVVGDADGVVALPKARVDEVLKASREREDKEASMMAALRAGASTIELMGLTP
ncbi:dimethylmenaquinone methyltransferase [Nocardioides sp. NPDC006273]|uniref:RraA family protein n=1 Tax=Nocardioides sp. NPDC006273 TaxID=3155598 RepID=UPI0033AEDB22